VALRTDTIRWRRQETSKAQQWQRSGNERRGRWDPAARSQA